MSKTTIEKRTKIEEQIKKLKREQKQLIQKEKSEADKVRIRRQNNRGALIEKLMLHLSTLSDSEFENYMKKTLFSESVKGGSEYDKE